MIVKNLIRPVSCRNKDRSLQRHSVEVTTGAGGYRHIRPNEMNRPKPVMTLPAEGAITEESMTSSGNSELADSNHAQMESAGGTTDDGRTTINFLPPALNCMVRLWDEISADMLQVRPQKYCKDILMILMIKITEKGRDRDFVYLNAFILLLFISIVLLFIYK